MGKFLFNLRVIDFPLQFCVFGIIAEHAFDPLRDPAAGLQLIPARHLFPANTTHVGIRRGTLLRRFEYDFIEDFAPGLNRDAVQKALQGGEVSASDWL